MDFDQMDEEEKTIRNEEYNTTIKGMVGAIEDDAKREDVLDELNRMSYVPSGNGALDAELVFLKAEKAARQSNRIEDKNVKSYARYIERDRGLTKAEIRIHPDIEKKLTFTKWHKDLHRQSEKPLAETQKDERQEPKARVRRHINRKRTVRPSRNKKERIRRATA